MRHLCVAAGWALAAAIIWLSLTPAPPRANPTETPQPNPDDLFPPPSPNGTADVIFANGTILTMDDANPSAEAIAIQGNKILAVGAIEDVFRHRGEATRVVDLEGRTLVPGFTDSHSHRIMRGIDGLYDTASMINDSIAQGWTSLAELFVPPDKMPSYVAFAEQNNFPLRVNMYLTHTGASGEPLGDWYKAYHQDQQFSPRWRIGGMKIFTGFDNDTTLIWTQQELNDLLLARHQEGWHLAIKTVSVETLEMILIALENLEKTDPNIVNRRVRLEHALFLTSDQIERVKRLGVIPSIQTNLPGQMIGGTDLTVLIAREPRGSAFPWRNLVSADVIIAGGSAFPSGYVDEPSGAPFGSPVRLIYQAVTRVGNLGVQPEPWMLDQTITAEQALRALTLNAAYANFQDDVLGSLTPGKLADMVILSDNPLSVSTPEINNINILMTMIDGNVEYCAAGFESLCASPTDVPGSVTATASASLPDHAASLAVDGSLNTFWNSGGLPEQWIQIDLGKNITLRGIKLFSAQFPNGATTLQIWAGPDPDHLISVYEFNGITREFAEVEILLPSPQAGVRYVKIVSTQGSSNVAWREVEILVR